MKFTSKIIELDKNIVEIRKKCKTWNVEALYYVNK